MSGVDHAAAALARFQAGDVAEAERICRNVCATGQVDADILHLLGLIERRKGNTAESVRILRMALSVNPLSPHAFFNLAMGRMLAGDAQHALTSLKQALAVDPQDQNAWFHLGRLQYEHEPVAVAARSFERACVLDPTALDARMNLMRLWRIMKTPRATDAHFRRWLAIAPDRPQGYAERAGRLLRQGDFAEVGAMLDRALILDPQAGETAVFNAHRHLIERNVPAALAAFSQCCAGNIRTGVVQSRCAPARIAAFPYITRSTDDAGDDKCVIVDPALYSRYGHHYNMTAAIHHEMIRRGYKTFILCGRMTIDTEILEKYPVIPHFFLEGHDILEKFHNNRDVLRFCVSRNMLFAEELKRAPAEIFRDATAVFHTVDANTALGIALWLDSLPVGTLRRLAVNVMAVDYLDPVTGRPSPKRRCYSALMRAARRRGVDLRLTAENTAIAADLAAISGDGRTVDLFPYHVVNALSDVSSSGAPAPAPAVAAKSGVSVAFLSGWTRDRGAHLLPEIIRLVRRRRPDMIFDVKMDWVAWEKLQSDAGGGLDTEAFSEPGVRLAASGMPISQYYAMLSAADIVLLPYAGRYVKAGSGIFYESLSLGKVMVTPQGSVMHAEAEQFGAGVVGFERHDAEAVARAVLDACDRLPALQAAAQTAAAWWKTRFSVQSCFDRILASDPPG